MGKDFNNCIHFFQCRKYIVYKERGRNMRSTLVKKVPPEQLTALFYAMGYTEEDLKKPLVRGC